MSILQTVDLKKHYRQGDNVTKALDGVSLAIEEENLLLSWEPPAPENPRCST